MRLRVFSVVFLLGIAWNASASWWELFQAENRMDFPAARSAALDCVASDPEGRQAIAAAYWWKENLENIPHPAEILDAARPPISAPLGFILSRIEADLRHRPPAGSPSSAVLSGPWGLFGRLELERMEHPPEAPPTGSVWQGPGSRYSYLLKSARARIETPRALRSGGYALARWGLKSAREFSGWMAVEIQGNANLFVDGQLLIRVRDAGITGPGIYWFRSEFASGEHRIEAAMAPQEHSRIRLSFFSPDGRPFLWQEESEAADNPVPARLAGETPFPVKPVSTLREATLQYALASWLRDAPLQRKIIDAILQSRPDDPEAHLLAASFFLLEQTGAGLDTDYRRAGSELEACRELPRATLLRFLLARIQERVEDADSLREELIKDFPGDPRILQLKIDQAGSRGWPREAEEALEDLERIIGRTPKIEEIRLDVLESLERWDEHHELLLEMAHTAPPSPGLVVKLADSCCSEAALSMLDQLSGNLIDPNFDADRIRLLTTSGHLDEARKALKKAYEDWGELPMFLDLGLMIEERGSKIWDETLRDALRQRPTDLDLRALGERHGIRDAFWEAEHIDAGDFLEGITISEKGVDAALLLDQAIEKVYPDGSSLYYYHGLTKALTPEGVSQASILQTLPGTEHINLRIIKPDGSVVVPGRISTGRGAVKLDEVEVGDVVEDEYIAPVSAISPSVTAHLSPFTYRFADPEKSFGLSEYQLIAPRNLPILLDGYFEGLEKQEEDREDVHVWRFKAEDMPPRPQEPFGPPQQDLLPWVCWGSGVSWEDIGDSIREKFLPVLRSSPELDEFVRKNLEGETGEKAIRNLFSALLEKIEHGNSDLDLGSTIGESFSRASGNRLGILAGGLVTMGYRVDLVLTRPTPLAHRHTTVPMMETFTIPVLRVRTGDHDMWLDPSEGAGGAGYLSPDVQDSDGLLIPLSDASQPVEILPRLPVFPNPMLEDRTEIRARINPDGSGRIEFSTWVTPPNAGKLAERLKGIPSDMLGPVYQRLISRYFPGAEKVDGSYQKLPDGRLKIGISFESDHACDVEDNEMECRSLIVSESLAPILASLPRRETPLILQVPIIRLIRLSITAPRGWVVDFGSQRRFSTRWGTVEEKLDREGENISSEIRLEIPALNVSPTDYAEFSRFLRAVDELLLRPPHLRRER